jgi:hypothetical protein
MASNQHITALNVNILSVPFTDCESELISETMKPFMTFWYNSTDGGSAHRKGSTYTGQCTSRGVLLTILFGISCLPLFCLSRSD